MITSLVESPTLEGVVHLRDGRTAELLHSSLLRLAEIATLDSDLVERKVGRLARRDRSTGKTAFRRRFSTWIGPTTVRSS